MMLSRCQNDQLQAGGAKPGATVVGRGSRRGGGRVLPEQITVLRTRPESITSKKGKTGTPLDLCANYFNVETTPNWSLYQYHVDIQPEEDSTGVRKALLRVHQKTLGGYLFDGTVLYTVNRLHPNPLELYSDRHTDNERMRLLIKLTCQRFFDPDAKIDIPEFKLQIWPGYKISINQYEDKLLLGTEITHKILRMDTVWQLLRGFINTNENQFKKDFLEEIVGKIVMTDYNKKIFRVDDVTFNESPKSTFRMKDQNISYIDYYYKKYNTQIPREEWSANNTNFHLSRWCW
ncbi:unnamed protein product, partial [Brenthis ino]